MIVPGVVAMLRADMLVLSLGIVCMFQPVMGYISSTVRLEESPPYILERSSICALPLFTEELPIGTL